MARSRTAYPQRTFSEPEQRDFFKVEPENLHHKQQRVFDSSAAEGSDGPVRRYEILKSTPLGLVFPQNVYFSLVDIDAGITQTGYSCDLPTSSSCEEPVIFTSTLKWWRQKYLLPPSFDIFYGSGHRHAPKASSRGRDDLNTSEIIGLPPSPQESLTTRSESSMSLVTSNDEKAYPLAEIKYKGWQGLTRMSISLTLHNITPSMH